MAGQEITVMSARRWLDVTTAPGLTILIHASVIVAGRDIFATSHHANWTAIMDSAMLQGAMPPTSASASLEGEGPAVTSAGHTGDAQTKEMMLAIIPMNVSAITMKMILRACATITF